jgi:hypothetical protein
MQSQHLHGGHLPGAGGRGGRGAAAQVWNKRAQGRKLKPFAGSVPVEDFDSGNLLTLKGLPFVQLAHDVPHINYAQQE